MIWWAMQNLRNLFHPSVKNSKRSKYEAKFYHLEIIIIWRSYFTLSIHVIFFVIMVLRDWNIHYCDYMHSLAQRRAAGVYKTPPTNPWQYMSIFSYNNLQNSIYVPQTFVLQSPASLNLITLKPYFGRVKSLLRLASPCKIIFLRLAFNYNNKATNSQIAFETHIDKTIFHCTGLDKQYKEILYSWPLL